MGVKSNTVKFVEKAIAKHGDKFNYDITEYIDCNKKVLIYCNYHEEYFSQTPTGHLNSGGCPKCTSRQRNINKTYTEQEVVDKFKLVHNNLYSYPDCNFTKMCNKINIFCNIHGSFSQIGSSHLQGHGCPKCNRKGWTKSQWIEFCNKSGFEFTKVYVIELSNKEESFIKIGISGNLDNRMLNYKQYNSKILHTIIGKPEYTYDLENKIHKYLKEYQYKPLIKFGGYTECFTLDCLESPLFKLIT